MIKIFKDKLFLVIGAKPGCAVDGPLMFFLPNHFDACTLPNNDIMAFANNTPGFIYIFFTLMPERKKRRAAKVCYHRGHKCDYCCGWREFAMRVLGPVFISEQ